MVGVTLAALAGMQRQTVPARIRPMRGQVVVRELGADVRSAVLWTPEPGQRDIKTHRGIVLALGPPGLLHGHEVPFGFAVGDVVGYHWEHNEDAFTLRWSDGLAACWLPQRCVDWVCE